MTQIHSALAVEKLAKAKSGIILNDPFFATLMFKLRFKQDDTCQTLWTNGVSIGYNPKFIENMSIDQVKGCIVHEIMHCIGKHPMRRGDRGPKIWNTACDYAINPLILETGKYSLPDDAFTGLRWDNKSAEEIYHGIMEDQQSEDGNPSDQNCNNGMEGSGNGDSSSNPGDASSEDQEDQNQDDQSKNESSEDGDAPGEQEQKPPVENTDPGRCGEVRDYPEPKQVEGEKSGMSSKEAAAEWDIATVQAAEAAKTCGQQLCGDLQKIIDDIKEPKQPWREVLARFMEEVSYNDYDWEVVDRSQLANNIILPSLHGKTFGNIAISVDVSGSISKDQVIQMLSEVFGILQTFNDTGKADAKIPIVYCSSHVHGYEEIGLDDTPTPIGSGGTRFAPAIGFVNRQFSDIKALIYLTDGYCNNFGPEPDYEVLWGICFDGIDKFEPPFGEVLYMEDADREA